MAVLPLVVSVILVGLVPSRKEPTATFFVSQRWGYRDVILVSGVITASQFISPGSATTATGMWLWAVNNGSTALLIIAAVWCVIRLKQRQPWRAIGLDRRTAVDNILWSLPIALGVVSGLTLSVLVVRLSLTGTHYAPSESSRTVWHGELSGFLAALAVTGVVGPIAEELFFRGLVHGPLLRRFGPRSAAVVSGVLWSTGHYSGASIESAVGMSLRLGLGICYAEAYRRRESLLPTLTFHVVGNTIAVFIRDPYLVTLVPLAGISIGLWIVSAATSRLFRRPRA